MFLRCEHNLTGEFGGRYQLTTGAWIGTFELRYLDIRGRLCLDRFEQKN